MAIIINLVGKDTYEATVTRPEGDVDSWKTKSPISSNSLIEELTKLGCHQTDIGDAFYEANPNWLNDQKN